MMLADIGIGKFILLAILVFCTSYIVVYWVLTMVQDAVKGYGFRPLYRLGYVLTLFFTMFLD